MEENLIKKVKTGVLIGTLSLGTTFSGSAYAADIFNGLKGPTDWQTDIRSSHSKKDKLRVLTNSLTLKYWDGEKIGKWGFISLPYKFIDTPNKSEGGIGDISIGFGPRGRIDNLHWNSYVSATLPTGGKRIGNERIDLRLGVLATYLTPDKKYEIDGSLEYRFTGKNKEDINSPNQISFALLTGGKLTNKTRLVTGFESLIKDDGNYFLKSRTVFRYTVSSSLFFEFLGDVGIDNKNAPKENSVILQARRNF